MKIVLIFPPPDSIIFTFIFLSVIISSVNCVFNPPFTISGDQTECSTTVSEERGIPTRLNIPPSVTLRRKNGGPFDKENDTFWYTENDPVEITFICTAPYPIDIYYNASRAPPEETRLFYTNFTDESTYTFHTSISLVFSSIYNGFNISCVSRPFPRLRSIVQHTFNSDFDDESHTFSLISSSSSSKSDEKPCHVKNKENVEDSNSSCPVIFYYEETVDPSGFETYNFYCQQQKNNNTSAHENGRWGNFTLHGLNKGCKTRGACENQALQVKEKYPDQYQNLFSNEKCWRRLEKGMKNCTDAECRPTTMTDFKTFIPECSGISNGKEDDVKFGSFGFFQIPRHFQQRPKIVFTEETSEQKSKVNTRIFMQRFNPRQLLNKVLHIKCSAISTFSIPAFQFALQFRGKNGNPDDFEYLSVENSTTLDSKFGLWYQTRQVDLNREDLIKIYCFVPVTMETETGGFEWHWSNVSRRIHVQNAVDYFKPSSISCPLSSSLQPGQNATNFDPPNLEISPAKHSFTLISTLLSDNDETESTTPLEIYVKCWANYPIQLVHNLQQFEYCPSASYLDCLRYFRKIQSRDSENKSTYSFTSQYYFDLTSAHEEKVIICQAAENPCLNRIVKYTRENDMKNEEISKLVLIKNEDEESAGTGGIQISSKNDDDDEVGCEAIFAYTKNPEFSNPEFRCQFTNGDKGNVSLHSCQNPVDCLSLYGAKTQSKTCWMTEALLKSCEKNCDVVRATYSPVFVTCVTENTRQESNLGNFAFFGIKPNDSSPAKMYPSLDDFNIDVAKNPSTVILMEKFPKIQYINGELSISCKFSRFYLELEVQLVLELSKKEEEGKNIDLFDHHHHHGNENKKETFLKFWNPTESRGSSDLTKWIKKSFDAYEYLYERKIRFEEGQNFESLERIYCMGGKFGSFEWLNASRPISVGTPKPPDVYLKLLKESPSLDPSSGQTGTLLQLANETHYNFELHSKNQSIICDIFAYPPPNVTWTSNSTNSLSGNSKTVQENSSHTRSVLFFDEISPSHEGVYNCTASNDRGLGPTTVSKSISIKVTAQKSLVYLFFLIPTAALVIAIGVVIGLSYRIKQLVPKEDIDKFIQGDENPDEENPNSSIFRIPYDREKLEIDRSLITLGELLGSGGFGEVYKAFVDRPETNESQVVGVKTVKKDTELKHFLAFLSEIKIMSYLEHHENVLGLIGVSTENIEEMKVWAVVEYCDEKDLKQFLEGKRRQKTFQCDFKAKLEPETETEDIPDGYKDISTIITPEPKLPPDLFTLDLLRFCKGISNGMKYLTAKKVIHGDLAARNILLTSTSDENKWCVKISDFGLSRTLGRSNYIRTQEKYLPWLWMSPESLEHKKFSIETDVWSFGVVCWEIFSLAQQPEYGQNIILLNYVQQGGRLPCPEYANSKIYELMRECWNWNDVDRPSFALLHERFSRLIDDIHEASSIGNASTRTCLSSRPDSDYSTADLDQSQNDSSSTNSEQ